MKEKTAKLKEKIEKDYKDMMEVINSTSLPLFVEDTIEDMHILIKTLIAENKELKDRGVELATTIDALQTDLKELKEKNNELEVINKMQEYRISVIDERELIPKSKVKELLKEIEKEGYFMFVVDRDKDIAIEYVQSLLGKE